jgi:DNA-binding NarL/FixJ family response regulator
VSASSSSGSSSDNRDYSDGGGNARLNRRKTDKSQSLPTLTPAQFRIAELIAKGHSNPEIAEALAVSRYTVESHLSTMFRRLGIRSRVELAVLMSSQTERLRPKLP